MRLDTRDPKCIYILNCKPFGGPPTLFWILNLGAGGLGLGLGAWVLDLGFGLVLAGFGLEVYTIITLGAMIMLCK